MNPLDPNSPFNGPLTPVHFRQNQSSHKDNPNPQKPKSTSRGRYVPLVLAGLALLILPVTIWQINQQQDIRQQASETPSVQERAIARVGEELITPADIDLEYTKQQNATTYLVTPTSLQGKILEELINKKLISMEAETRGISATDDEVDSKIEFLESVTGNLNINREVAKDMVLEEKITVLVAPSITATIAFSNEANTQTLSFFEALRESALEENNLSEAVDPFMGRSNDINLFENIIITQSNDILTSTQIQEVFDLEPDSISEVMENNNRFFIIQVLSNDEGEYESFEAFLNEKRSGQVEILTN